MPDPTPGGAAARRFGSGLDSVRRASSWYCLGRLNAMVASRLGVGVVWVLLAGCGRVGFELRQEIAEPDAASDAEPPPRDSASEATVGCSVDCVNGDCVAGECACEPGWQGAACDARSPLGTGADGTIVFESNVNLSTANRPGRSCADGGDAVGYSVIALSAASATVDGAVSPGCLVAGDEVLVVNLQGTPGATDNTGRFEFLIVESASGDTVTFTTEKRFDYGATGDAGLGTARDSQRVTLQRVPHYEDVTIRTGVAVTANGWDGVRGGVLAFRSRGTVRIDGRLTMDGKGFAGGAPTTAPNATGEQGESTSGHGTAALEANAGGGGGGRGGLAGAACETAGLPGAGGGHHAAGNPPVSPSCAVVSAGGAAYGDIEAMRVTLGSGGGAGGTPASLSGNPSGGAGGSGGGIIYVFAEIVQGSGVVSAIGLAGEGNPSGAECAGGDAGVCFGQSGPGGGGAGGLIAIRAPTVTLGALSIRGGPGGNGLDTETGDGGAGGEGVLVVSGLE